MIAFFTEQINFNLKNKRLIKKWISNTIKDFGKKVGDINFIFTSDEYLYKMNVEYLNHDYYTDVITFDYVENDKISGDIFISIDRVADNAKKYNVSFEDELFRVMIHGVLHLLGFDDHSEEEKQLMREKENFYLNKLKTLEK